MIAFVSLPFPAKALWPNGRAHWATKSREVKKHREWARIATLSAIDQKADPEGRVSLALTVRPKTRHPIDRDNAVSAMKAYADGIADALGVDDRIFETPTVTMAEPTKGGAFEIGLTYQPRTAA